MTEVTFELPPTPLQALLAMLDTSRVQHDLARLCAADFAGRRIGTNGHDRAAAWLGATMDGLGLAAETFAFTLEQPVLHLSAAPLLAILDATGTARQVLAHRRDFAEHPASAECPRPIAGLARRWQESADACGAWIILDEVPSREALQVLGTQLAAQGALGLLLPQHSTSEGYLSKRVVAASPIALPVIAVRSDLLPNLDGERVQASLPLQRLSAHGQVILGRLDGTDISLAQSPLIVGAHYDGVGDDPGGLRIPGAADNAAGVAVVLQLARVALASALRPRRPIIFAAFDGEEVQAQGSLAYAQHLRAEGSAPLVINLDGAARWAEAVWVEAGTRAEALIAALDIAGEWLEIPLILGNVASDNRRYAGAHFPSVGVALGGASGHSPGDVLEHVDIQAMHLAARLLLSTIWQLAF